MKVWRLIKEESAALEPPAPFHYFLEHGACTYPPWYKLISLLMFFITRQL